MELASQYLVEAKTPEIKLIDIRKRREGGVIKHSQIIKLLHYSKAESRKLFEEL
jgi:hypothetical protein